MSEAREEWLRRAMGLGGSAPDPVGVRLAGGQFRVAPESQRAVDFDAWHREGARARLATGIAYLPQRFCRRWRQVRERGEMLRGQRALAQAPTLCYCSPHIHPIGETDDIEGWFTFGSAGYRLDIITPGLLAQATHEDWTRGSVLRADRAAWFSADWLLVPADTLDDELIAEAITRWYRERFKYQRGHWSHLEGRLPAVEINLAWEHPHKL